MSVQTMLASWVGGAAKRAMVREQPFVIGITGSVGKSSTKQLVGSVLQASILREGVRIPQKNYNNELGLPLTILDLPAPGRSPFAWIRVLARAVACGWLGREIGAQRLVLEMGADKPGDLAYLTSIAKPNISVITAVSPERPQWAPVHAANYPTIADLAYEKATLARALAEDGTLVLNADDCLVMDMKKQAPSSAHVLTFGTAENATVRLISTNLRLADTPNGALPIGLEITLAILQRTRTVYLPGVFGRSIAYGLAASACVALALDISTEEMLEGWSYYTPLPGRARLIPGVKGTMLFDDTYNASPVSMMAALRDLGSVPTSIDSQQKIACLGEMRELGEQAEMLHEEIGKEAALAGVTTLAVTGAFAEAYARGAMSAGMPGERIHIFDDTPELGTWVQDILRAGDLVLAKSSQGTRTTKGVRLERVIEELMAEPQRAGELLCRQEEAWKTRA